jgi:hypothetical protein
MAGYARKNRGPIATGDLDSSSDDEPMHDNSGELDLDSSDEIDFDNSAEHDHDELHQHSPDDETVPVEPQEDDVDIEQALEDELDDYDLAADEDTLIFGEGHEDEEGDQAAQEEDEEEGPVDQEDWEEDQAVREYEEQPILQADEEEDRAVQEVKARPTRKRPARAQTTRAPKKVRQRRKATDAEATDDAPLINLSQSGVRGPIKQRRRKKATAPKATDPKAKALAKKKKKKKKRKQQVPSAELAATESAEPVATESASQGSVVECGYGVRMTHLEDIKRCCKCQNILPATIVSGLRLKRKTQGALMCKVCGTRQVQVSRVFKEAGYSKQFSGLSKELKEQFWKRIREDGSKANILKMAKRSLIAYEDREIRTGALGDYKPLSWYDRQGYDPKAIQEKCDDTMEHKVLGICYRVEFVGGGEIWKKGTRQTDEFHDEEKLEGNSVHCNSASSSSSRASAAATAAAQQAAAAKEKMANFKKQMAELQKTKQKHEDEAQKVLKEVSGELFIVAQLVKSKQLKCLEKNYTALAEGLTESQRKLGLMKKEALECIAEGSPCNTTEKVSKAVVKSCLVQRQFVYKIIRKTQ